MKLGFADKIAFVLLVLTLAVSLFALVSFNQVVWSPDAIFFLWTFIVLLFSGFFFLQAGQKLFQENKWARIVFLLACLLFLFALFAAQVVKSPSKLTGRVIEAFIAELSLFLLAATALSKNWLRNAVKTLSFALAWVLMITIFRLENALTIASKNASLPTLLFLLMIVALYALFYGKKTKTLSIPGTTIAIVSALGLYSTIFLSQPENSGNLLPLTMFSGMLAYSGLNIFLALNELKKKTITSLLLSLLVSAGVVVGALILILVFHIIAAAILYL